MHDAERLKHIEDLGAMADRVVAAKAQVKRLEEIKGGWPDWKKMIDQANDTNKGLIEQRDALQVELTTLKGERDGLLRGHETDHREYADIKAVGEALIEENVKAVAELETARKALDWAQTDIHNAYCEGDEEGNWDHVPRCVELEALKGGQGD